MAIGQQADRNTLKTYAGIQTFRVAPNREFVATYQFMRLPLRKEAVEQYRKEIAHLPRNRQEQRLRRFMMPGRGEDEVALWNLQTGELIRKLENSTSIYRFNISTDSSQVIGVARFSIRIWDAATGHLAREFKADVQSHESGISPDGKYVALPAYGGRRGYTFVNTATGESTPFELSGRPGYSGVTFHPRRPTYVLGGAGFLLYSHRPSGRNLVYVTPPHSATNYLTFSGDGDKLFAYGSDEKVVVYDTREWNIQTILTVNPFSGPRLWAQQIPVSPDGSLLAIQRQRIDGLDVYDVQSGKPVKHLPIEKVSDVQFITNRLIAVSSRTAPLQFFDPVTGKVSPPPKPLRATPTNDDVIDLALPERMLQHRQRGEFDKAIALGPAVLAEVEKRQGDRHPETLRVARALAACYRAKGRHDEAIRLFLRCHQESEAALTPETTRFSTDLSELVHAYLSAGRPTQALELVRLASENRARKLGASHLAVAHAEYERGQLHWRLHDPVTAKEHYAKSLHIRRSDQRTPPEDLGSSMMMLGRMHRALAEYDKALSLLEEAAAHFEKTLGETHILLAEANIRLCGLYLDLNRNSELTQTLQKARTTYRASADKEGQAGLFVLRHIAYFLTLLKRSNESEALIRDALEQARKLYGENDVEIAEFQAQMASMYYMVEMYDTGLRYQKQAVANFTGVFGDDFPGKPGMLTFLGQLFLKAIHNGVSGTDNYRRERAEECFLEARNIADPATAYGRDVRLRSLLYLAGIQLKVSRIPVRRLGIEFDAKLDAEALNLYDTAVREMHANLEDVLPIMPDSMSARYAAGAKRQLDFALTAAHDVARRPAVNEEENQAKAAWIERSAEWLINLKGLANEVLANRTLLLKSPQDAQTEKRLGELMELRAEIAAVSGGGLGRPPIGPRAMHIRDLLKQERELSAELGRNLRGHGLAPKWVSLAQVREKLDPQTVLIEVSRFQYRNVSRVTERWGLERSSLRKRPDYLTREEYRLSPRYVAWIIPPKGKGEVRLVVLGRAPDIEPAIEAYHRQIELAPEAPTVGTSGRPEPKAHDAVTDALSAELLTQLEPEVKAYKRWLISPDASLWLVPLGALRTSEGKYVIESHEVACLTTSRSLVAPKSPAKPQAPVIVANPDYDMGTQGFGLGLFSPLPASAKEAQAVAPHLAKYAGQTADVYVKKLATEKTVKSLAHPRVLLLSTHAYFSETSLAGNPLLGSGLALAGANRASGNLFGIMANAPTSQADDGILTALEVVGMDLAGTDLVVLSACETGRGLISRGEGVAGLRQAFQLAGAKSVVASLWSVPDQSTAQLMTEFFKQLADGKRTTEAIRLAQLSILRSSETERPRAHPLYWAAFTVSGSYD